MKKLLSLLASLAALVCLPAAAVAAPTCLPGQTPGAPPLYCVPPPAVTAADLGPITHATAAALSKLTPAQLRTRGALKLTVVLPGAGTVTVTLTAKLGAHSLTLASGHASGEATSHAALRLALTKAGRAGLRKHRGRLQVAIAVVFTQEGSTTSINAQGKATLK